MRNRKFPITMNVPIESKDLTVTHLVSECGKMTQTEYKGRHDRQAVAFKLGSSEEI